MKVVFVTAIYNLHGGRSKEIWERFSTLSSIIPTYIVCSPSDYLYIPKNAYPIFRHFHTLQTYKALYPYNGLPPIRSGEKDTKEYNILMNAKAEFLQLVKNIAEADHYIWIDAGIGKIFKSPLNIYKQVLENVHAKPFKSDTILIPGCHNYQNTNIEDLATRIFWHFAGGFFVVPHGLIELFHAKVLEGCTTIGTATGKTIWEVNIWSYVEPQLPIQWEKGDHDESIIAGLLNYYA
jgi:hypothetical protein